MVDLVAARAGLIEQLRPRAFKSVDNIPDHTDLYSDLGINGADLLEVLQWVHATYGTDLAAITPRDYDINEPPDHWFGPRSYKSVRISELLAAIERSSWIVPT